MAFDYSLDFKNIDFRQNPQLYQSGKGEQGVLLVEPYKSEILPYWKFRTPQIAKKSAEKIYNLFLEYKAKNDFVGMDMARKFLQMGFTRSRRYANHKSGKKYLKNPQQEKDPVKQKVLRQQVLPQVADWATNDKALSAKIFYEKYLLAKNDEEYVRLKKEHTKSFSK